MIFIAIVVGMAIGMMGGLWVMRYVWSITSDGYFEQPIEKREKWLAERKSKVGDIFALKMLIKITIPSLLALISWLIYKL